ncbi:rRNA biogenesis protein rrp5 [Exophiala dermatitidis]
MASAKRKLTGDEASTKPATKRSKSDSKPKAEAASTSSAQDKKAKPNSVSVLAKEQPAFPRGGAGVLTPLERKQIQKKATRDAEREQKQGRDLFDEGSKSLHDTSDEEAPSDVDTEVKKPTKRQRKKKARSKDAADTTEPEVRIEGLSYKRITTGSLILGQITAVSSRTLTVALPNNLVGYVPLTSISAQLSEKIQALLNEKDEEEDSNDSGDEDDDDIALTNYFHVGQYLRVAVTSTEQDNTAGKAPTKRRIELSVQPSLTNVGIDRANLALGATVQVAVSSIEDHGLVADLALEDQNVRGFIPKSQLPASLPLSSIKTGSVFLCSVIELGSSGRVVKLSADPSKWIPLATAPSVDTFLPGTKAEILVENKTEVGLSGKIMGLVDATADLVHSGSFRDKEAFLAKYEAGKKIHGRLICTFPLSETKKLGFSVLQHVLDMEPTANMDGRPEGTPALSSIVDAAPVIRVEPGLGIYLQLSPNTVGFAHVSRLSDDKVEMLSETSGPFKLGSEHKARIIEYNPVDDLYLVSLQKKVLEQSFLRYEDVPLGAIVKATIEKLLVGPDGVRGLVVNLAEGISGLVPQIHLSDVELKHPERKFREGQTVTARVITTDPQKKRIRLTLKKTLVNSDQKPWLRYEDIESGDSTLGTLTKVDPLGAVVRFYGPVRGFLPVSEMSEAYIKDATEHFRVGQVVTVTAISVNPAERRLTVSCRDINKSNPSIESSLSSLEPGTIVKGTVFEKSQDDILLRLDGSDAIARLTKDHVSDGSSKKRESAFNKIRVGQKLEDVVVLQVLPKRRLVMVSNKQSLIKAAQVGTLLKSYEQLQPNALVTGFVSNITSDGVFVSFAGGISGLITKAQVPVEATDERDFGMTKFQPVTAKVLSIDYKGATPRFWLTMRENPANTRPEPAAAAVQDVPALVNPVDTELKTINDLSVGRVTKARIISVKDTQINVELAKDVQGRIDASEIFDEWKDIKDRKRPLKQFSPKQELTVKILGAHDTRNHRFLPLTHRNGKNTVFELSCKPSTVAAPNNSILKLTDLSVGSSWLAFVNNISENGLWVNISPSVRGRIRATDVSDDLSLAANLEKAFPIGSALKVHVLAVDPEKNRLDLTARSDGLASSLTIKDVSKGLVLPGRVTRVTDRNILVQLSDQAVGAVDLIDMADNYNEANPAKFQKNDILRVCVLKVDVPNKKIQLSTRPSKVLSSSMKVTDPEITSISQLSVNDVVRGFISNVSDKGVFVTLGHGVTAFVRVTHLSDSFLKEWKDHFQRDQLVKGKIIMIDQASGHVQMSLKESALDPNYKAPLTFNDLHVGDIVTGKVVKVEPFGVFIAVDNSENVRGLCHRSEIAEKRVEDATKLFKEGDAVKAKVLKLDPAQRKVNFGMKASYFIDTVDDDAESEADSDAESHESGGAQLDEDEDEDMQDADDSGEEEDANDSDDDEDDPDNASEVDGETGESDDSEAEEQEVKDSAAASQGKGLNVGGFNWYGMPEAPSTTGSKRAAEESSSDEDVDTAAKVPKKKKKRAEIQVDRTGDLDVDGPHSIDDFERLLMSEPDSSLLWLQYMAFHLELGDADQARQIGERALKSIGLGQEAEKLNVWVALLNLENAYGDDETIEAIFKRACEYNDPQEIYSRLTSIYIQSGKHDKADELFQRMLKKFAQDPKVWINYATFLFDRVGDADKARALLPRALQTLPKFTHFDTTLKFAQLEFKSPNGLAERGRTIFEGLISSFPKRVDLFNVLLDLELKQGDREQIRALFERVFSGRLKPKQAKYFFKRWLAFEEAEGDERQVEAVKARAAEWIRAAGKDVDI